MSKILYAIYEEEVQRIALSRLGRELTRKELSQVRRALEWGHNSWEDTLRGILDDIIT